MREESKQPPKGIELVDGDVTTIIINSFSILNKLEHWICSEEIWKKCVCSQTCGYESCYVWKNTLNGINSTLDTTEENSSELEDTAIEIIPNKTWRERRGRKTERGLKHQWVWEIFKQFEIRITEVPERWGRWEVTEIFQMGGILTP